MIKRIAHVCISALDLEQTRKFYCEALGMKVKFFFRKAGTLAGYYLDAGSGTFIEVFARSAEMPGGKQPIQHICLEVESVDETASQLKKHGVRVGDKTLGSDKSWQAWLEDPNAVKIELHEYTKDSCQHTGKDCEISW